MFGMHMHPSLVLGKTCVLPFAMLMTCTLISIINQLSLCRCTLSGLYRSLKLGLSLLLVPHYSFLVFFVL